MRTSAATVLLAFACFSIQVAFSDGAALRLASLPIGIVPAFAGAMLLCAGVTLGLIFGTGQYRVATGLAVLGTAFCIASLSPVTMVMFPPRQGVTPTEILQELGILVWLTALLLGMRAIVRSMQSPLG